MQRTRSGLVASFGVLAPHHTTSPPFDFDFKMWRTQLLAAHLAKRLSFFPRDFKYMLAISEHALLAAKTRHLHMCDLCADYFKCINITGGDASYVTKLSMPISARRMNLKSITAASRVNTVILTSVHLESDSALAGLTDVHSLTFVDATFGPDFSARAFSSMPRLSTLKFFACQLQITEAQVREYAPHLTSFECTEALPARKLWTKILQ